MLQAIELIMWSRVLRAACVAAKVKLFHPPVTVGGVHDCSAGVNVSACARVTVNVDFRVHECGIFFLIIIFFPYLFCGIIWSSAFLFL